MVDAALDLTAYRQSVQYSENRTLSYFGGEFSYLFAYNADDILPLWGTKYRDLKLRQFYRKTGNTLFQSAIANLVKSVAATPWEIEGGRNKVRYYQDILQSAQFGQAVGGWRGFLLRLLTDYFTQDYGAYGEIIAPGDASKKVNTKVLGLAHLDAIRCFPTRDPEYPVIYRDIDGKFHDMHYTRIFRLVDMPDPDENTLGIGLSALSRSIAVVNAQIMMHRYMNERLDDLPPAGIMAINNVDRNQVDMAINDYAADRRANRQEFWANVMRFTGVDPQKPISIEFTSFANVPEHFDFSKYMEEHAILIADAIGIDPQDIRPLSGAALGTGAQSKTLHAKGRGRAMRDVLTALERIINIHVLPEDLEFRFKHRDGEEDAEIAAVAQTWTTIADNAQRMMSKMEQRMLIANQVPAIADVLEDEQGMVRLPDDDVIPEGQATAEDNTDVQTASEAQTAQADAGAPAQQPSADSNPVPPQFQKAAKAYSTTKYNYTRDLTDMIRTAQSGGMDRRRAGIVMRALNNRYGLQSMRDGLADGGVQDTALSETDQKTFNAWLVDQSSYTTAFLNDLYNANTVSVDPADRAALWARKSLDSIYAAGLVSADKNGMYVFTGDDGHESCRDCQRWKGQIHRLKDWQAHNADPRQSSFAAECGGWNCQHTLKRTSGSAQGRF